MNRIVETKYGKIKGLAGSDPRITSFKGIPYAKAPVGDLRWRAPQDIEAWDGIKEAFEYAPIAFQDTPGLGTDLYCREWHVDPTIAMSEDCLYLNVWAPPKKEDAKYPVLVFIHGGAFQWGYPSEMEFDGEMLSRRGIIVVTIAYRLASFGFLSHPDAQKEDPKAPANFGLLDQKKAVRWVYENIDAFGGDNTKITVAGQSAGGASVLSLISDMDNEGIISGAFIMSGMIRDPFHEDHLIVPKELSEAQKEGVQFFDFLGVKTLEEARKIDSATIRAKYGEYVSNHDRMTPVIDHTMFDEDPYEAFLGGRGLNIPVISGNTTEEFFTSIEASSEEEYKEKVRNFAGDRADEFLSFPEAKVKIGEAYCPLNIIELSVKTAFMRRSSIPSIDKPFYYYSFGPDMPGDNEGVFHSSDLWFFLNTLDKCWRPLRGRHYDLSRQMSMYFVNFVKTGNPNGLDDDGTYLPQWDEYNKYDRNVMEFTKDGAAQKIDTTKFIDFLAGLTGDVRQGMNPYMPYFEYVPDGEPHVFGDRVYVYGSHDEERGSVFCVGDYVCYSASVNNLREWKYEGVIYGRCDDPVNRNGHMCLYAPDVTKGPDGRYYLYYVLDKVSRVSVAVSDTPAGRFRFLGYVHYKDGSILGEREGDEPQFDPGVLTEGEVTYLYTGFCGQGDKSRHGAMATVLESDMLTVKCEPRFVAPGCMYSEGTGYEGHAFFEAPSIRKISDTYYFIYSSEVMHELCYATSKNPTEGFEYQGVIVSNADMHIDTYKAADVPAGFGANNHGSIEKINDNWYIFYHRHTNGTWYSRQGCAEFVHVNEDGFIPQVEMTSQGLNCEPLLCTEEYPAYIACNMFSPKNEIYVAENQMKIVAGRGKKNALSYVSSIKEGNILGFKYFDVKDVTGMYLWCSGYANGCFEISLTPFGEPVGKIDIGFSNVMKKCEGEFKIPDGVRAIYLKYAGSGEVALKSFGFIRKEK